MESGPRSRLAQDALVSQAVGPIPCSQPGLSWDGSLRPAPDGRDRCPFLVSSGCTLTWCHSQPSVRCHMTRPPCWCCCCIRRGRGLWLEVGTGTRHEGLHRGAGAPAPRRGGPHVGLSPGEITGTDIWAWPGATSPEISWSRIGCRLSLIIMITSRGRDSGTSRILAPGGNPVPPSQPWAVANN